MIFPKRLQAGDMIGIVSPSDPAPGPDDEKFKSGLVTFHGNDLMWGLGRDPAPYDRDEFITCLVEGASGEIDPNCDRRTVRGGTAEGKMLGGNLNCLMKLAGTPYFPDFSGSLLFLEALNFSPLP